MQTQAGQLLKVVAEVRNNLNAKLADVLAPVQHWLNKLARRLEVEGDMNYRAYTNAINAHSFTSHHWTLRLRRSRRTSLLGWMCERAKNMNRLNMRL